MLETDRLPLYDGALAAAERGVRTGGDKRNREYLHGHVLSEAPDALDALCFDPQTSGGLLAAVTPELVGAAEAAGFTVVGRVEAAEPGVRLA